MLELVNNQTMVRVTSHKQILLLTQAEIEKAVYKVPEIAASALRRGKYDKRNNGMMQQGTTPANRRNDRGTT